ncbi:MAG: hypothetical protein HY673_08855 [Chloroflexi bacterium]|nr:hypothetical protein [Chloroflexota bacterium]
MTRKWLYSAIALLLVLTALLGACSERAPTVTQAPAVTQSPAAPAQQPTSPPVSKSTSPAAASPTTPPAAKPTSPPAARPTTQPLSKAAPAPKPERVVVLVDSLGNEGFLPHNDSATAFKLMPVYETLWDLDPATRRPVPMLAETLPRWSDDGKTLSVSLRQGIQFHDGWGEFTAEDVKFGIELGGRKGSVSPGFQDMAKVKVEITGTHKLAIQFDKPDWAWALSIASTGRLMLPIISKKYVEKVGEAEAGRHPIGTGPFKFVKHEVGQSVEYEAVPNHWRVTPDYKTLVVKVIKEPGTAISMLRTGEADITAIPLSFVPEAKAAGLDIRVIRNIGVIGVALGGQYLPTRESFDPNVPWVLAKEPEKALKVRKALNLAVNRQEIIDKVLNGIGGQWSMIGSPNEDASYDSSMKPYPYDPDQAKRLLAEAGYPNGFETTMVLFPSTGHATREVAEAVAIYWEKIGIRVKRLPVDQATHRTRQVGRKNAGFAYPAYRNFYDEEFVGGASAYLSDGAGLNQMFEYPELDRLIKSAATELDQGKRLAIALEFHKKIYENYYAVPVSVENMPIAVGKRLGEWPIILGDSWLGNFERIKLK